MGTGAGDPSIAAFLAAMLEESPLNECVQLAAAEKRELPVWKLMML